MGNEGESDTTKNTSDHVPVFNKRLFMAQGAVMLTKAARQIMEKNSRALLNQQLPQPLSKAELHAIQCVVDGLTLIHRGQAYVKEALSHVVTLESYDTHQYVERKGHELQLSCYYIVSGAVMVTYDVHQRTETRSVHQPDIIYNHSAGEFLGIVSLEGIHDDLSPPATVCTKEPTDFIRIDRQKFHELIDVYKTKLRREKLKFFKDPQCLLSRISPDVLEKILPYITKLEAPASKTVVDQDEVSDDMFFIVSGRCQLTRRVIAPAINLEVTFHLDNRESFSFFAEECILTSSLSSSPSTKSTFSSSPSLYSVTTTTHTVFFKLNRAALEIVSKEQLYNFLSDHAHTYPSDVELRLRAYTLSLWNQYKYFQVKSCLTESGAEHKLVGRRRPDSLGRQPLTDSEKYKEIFLKFALKGSNLKPKHPPVSSLHSPGKKRTHRLQRPKTVSSRLFTTPGQETTSELRTRTAADEEVISLLQVVPSETQVSPKNFNLESPRISSSGETGQKKTSVNRRRSTDGLAETRDTDSHTERKEIRVGQETHRLKSSKRAASSKAIRSKSSKNRSKSSYARRKTPKETSDLHRNQRNQMSCPALVVEDVDHVEDGEVAEVVVRVDDYSDVDDDVVDDGESSLSLGMSDTDESSGDEVFVSRPVSDASLRGSKHETRQDGVLSRQDFLRERTTSRQEDDDVLMASSVFVSMKTEDIVRKAKAIAEKSKSRQDDHADDNEKTEKWYTSLHRENEKAKNIIVANKYRSAFLRRRMGALARKRQKESESREHQMRQMPLEDEDMEEMATQLTNSSSIMMRRSTSWLLDKLSSDEAGGDSSASQHRELRLGSSKELEVDLVSDFEHSDEKATHKSEKDATCGVMSASELADCKKETLPNTEF